MGLIMKNGIQYPGNVSSGGEGSYTLPIASTKTLGGIKVGENLSITEDGTLNAEASGTSVLSPGAILYDTEEKVIGKWINGKPLYQKVGEIDTSIIDKIVYQSKDPYVSIIPPMNQNETDEIKITAAGFSGDSFPYRAFDKSYTGYEVSWYHNTSPTWVQVQFKIEPKKINKIKIGQEIASPAFFKTYIIQGSNDGTTYIDIATFVENYRNAGQIYEHIFDNENSYSYYRIYFPDNAHSGGGVSVEEIELFEIDYTDVITYYTKTADAENSFNIGMVENINLEQNIDFSNIYSLDEKIIGTWIDGKNIYQKTYNTNNISLDVSEENIENIINGFVCIENDEENQIPLIPIISGENDKILCSNETSWNGYIHYAWKLFNGYNGDETGAWGVNGVGNSSINWVSYRFDKPIIPKKCLLRNSSIYTQNATIEFQFSKNGEDWVTLGGPYDAREYNIAGEEKYYEFENNETYSYFRFYVIGCLSAVNGFICVDCVQVYGFETKYKKTMSSDIITFKSNNLVIDKPLNSIIKSVTIQYTKTTD